ncbi:MAG: DUF4920 domain-containing protein [Sphingobacteriaceae bacterium]|nr:MAG: DUF4920 domain-containing protein [Sphingobacteriaceae bacterium]
MRTFLLLFASLCFTIATFAQNNIKHAAPGINYGDKVTAGTSIQLSQLNQKFATDSVYKGKVTGKVVEVCKKKGCFMALSQTNTEPVMVRFTNYAYFMPQNIVGKTVVVEGVAKVKTTSVERLQHFAKDLGKSSEEIAKITKPKTEVEIMADGVLVVD